MLDFELKPFTSVDVRPARSLAEIMEAPDLWSCLSKHVSFINTLVYAIIF